MPRPTLRWLTLLALLLPTLATGGVTKDKPFAASLVAPELQLAPGQSGELVVHFDVLPQHFIYRDMSGVAAVEADGVKAAEGVFPKGKDKYDSVSEMNREVFEQGFDVKVAVSVAPGASPGPHTLKIPVKYQGCNVPENYCLFPVKTELTATVQVSAPRASLLDLLIGSAHAGGGSSRPAEPTVDFSGLPATADVQESGADDELHPVRARLLTDRTALTPGETVRLAVHLSPRENWHTYWKSPGDIGLPTKIRWTLPEGATAGDFEFPVPERFDQEGIVSYGYDGPVLFFSEIALPATLPEGEATLGAHAEWLVCEIMCIRGEADLSLTLPVGPSEDSPFAGLMDHYTAQHPTHPTEVGQFAVETAFSASAIRPEEAFKLALRITPTGDGPLKVEQKHGTYPLFTPIVSLNGMVNETKVETLPDGAIQIVVEAETFEADELPTEDVLGGLIEVHVGDQIVRTEVSVPVPWAAKDSEVLASTSPLFSGAAAAMVAAVPAEAALAAPAAAGETSFLWMLLLAFFGGMLLNVMPCVLPVLTMKLYSLVAQVDITPAKRRVAGYAYSAGIVASFLALAAAVVIMKTALGQDVLWGFQFQYPPYVAALATIVFAFGLSLFGVFEVPAFGANQAAQASNKDGAFGYFLTGVFATLLATPCSAPFLGTGMGFAFSLPTAGILLFFGVAGFGLAFPFLLIAVVPALYRFMPRPGAWMETFKHVMGFSLIATTLWLVDVLAGQVGRDGATGFLAFLFFVSLGGWMVGRFGSPLEEIRRQVVVLGLAIVVMAGGGWKFLELDFAETTVAAATDDCDVEFTDEIPWQPFSEAQVKKLSGTPLFIDFTADWCLTCKVNEKTVLATSSVREAMDSLGVCPLKADWTRKDVTITEWLKRYGKAGVPFYLVMPADPEGQPIALPEVITPALVVEAMEKAAGQG
jgi:thiol:disulfide interchange protein/DsbC/DsbD-like thiol-disulfide interchange protein